MICWSVRWPWEKTGFFKPERLAEAATADRWWMGGGVASLLARPRCGERLLAPGSRVGEEPRWRSRRCCEMSDGWLRLRAAPRV